MIITTSDECNCFSIIQSESESDTPMFTLLSRGCHLSPDEARGRMPVPVGPAERGRLPGASPLLRQGFIEPGGVVHPVSCFRMNLKLHIINRHGDNVVKMNTFSVVFVLCLCCRNAQTRELSHPLPVMRAREMDEWSRSQEYRTLLQKMFR